MQAAPQERARDVIVVGAGIVGLSCAWRAAQRGLSVLVLERDRAGAGASGVAAGMLAPVTEADFGEEALLALSLEGLEAWPPFAAELAERSGAATGHRRDGALVVAADRDDAEELRRLAAFQRSLGLEAEWLSGRECRRLEPGLSPRVPGGILAPCEGHVDPQATVEALVAALAAAGGELRAGTAVSGLVVEGDRVAGVETAEGIVPAEHVVVAAGAWSGRLPGHPLAVPVRPVKGQILTLRRAAGAPPLADRLVRTPRCYLVPRADGRVVVGATMEERGFDRRVTAEGVFRLLEAAREVLPDVDELELVEARAGLRPGSPDNAPIIGPGAIEGLVWATGHHRNGVLLAPLTAHAVAAILTVDEPPPAIAPFGPDRFGGRPASPSAPERARDDGAPVAGAPVRSPHRRALAGRGS